VRNVKNKKHVGNEKKTKSKKGKIKKKKRKATILF
jgi:hypothetical protein